MPFPTRLLCATLPTLLAVPAAASPPAEPAARPRDIVIFIADGWGFAHAAAAALYAFGRPEGFVWDSFPVRLAMTTGSLGGPPEDDYVHDTGVADPVTDSAAAATAISTGAKTRNGVLGETGAGELLEHLMTVAERAGRATGVVTTVPLSHATPAGFAVHNPSRGDYAGVAREMLLDTGLDVIMGAGHPWHDADGARRDAPPRRAFRFVGGPALWDSLTGGLAGNDADGDGVADPWTLIEDREAFLALRDGPAPRRVLGVARVAETLQQERGGNALAAPYEVPPLPGVPDLPALALAALNVLDADPDGFVVMIEGGAVDWAAHDNQSGRVIEELLDFHAAVRAVLDWLDATGRRATALVIVTGDHETGGLELAPDAADRARRGALPPLRWTTKGHTARPIPFFAAGPGSGRFVDRGRPVPGAPLPTIDNTEVGTVVKELLR